jgi:hypothetical protein
MVNSMSVRCPQCFYENEERYRFCGMCGVALPRIGSASSERDANLHRAPAPAVNSDPEPAKERQPAPASVPSFLGLSQERNPYPDRSLDYLLEDEPEPSRTRMYLAIVLLVAAVAMLAWRWRHSGFFSPTPPAVVTTPSNPTPNSPDASAPETSATPAASAPAASSNPDTAASNPPVPAKHGSPRESDLPASGAPINDASKSVPPEQTGETAPGNPESSAAKPDTSSAATTSPAPAEKPVTIPPHTAKVMPRAPRAAPAQVVPTASLQDPSETEGEKYLYGHGAPQNCARAEKSLLSAAQHANPKAQSVLGTMYATGHCVGRDLPTAYRWFAKASHQDPNNDRITRDLEVLWKQMTPGERQLAVNNRE